MPTENIKIGNATPTKICIGDTEISKCYIGENVVWEKGGSSGETWVINEVPNFRNVSFNVSFTSNGNDYNTIRKGGTGPSTGLYYDNTGVYNLNEEWINEAYRTIAFATPPTGDLLTWLQDNAVKQ